MSISADPEGGGGDVAPRMETPRSCWGLAGLDVHIWHAWLDQPTAEIADLAGGLSADEHERAGRFQFARDRERFVYARAILRILLGGYLAAEPSGLVFVYGKHGKPALAEDWRDADLQFNLAHSNGCAVYAFTRTRAIGVDLEYVRPVENMLRLATLVFSPRELAALHAAPAGMQRTAFFNGWTRKEAFVKATGDGLSMPLEHIDVSLAPGERTVLLRLEGKLMQGSAWTVRELQAPPSYSAAVAVAGIIGELTCRHVVVPGAGGALGGGDH